MTNGDSSPGARDVKSNAARPLVRKLPSGPKRTAVANTWACGAPVRGLRTRPETVSVLPSWVCFSDSSSSGDAGTAAEGVRVLHAAIP
jgi:hypothetical protein